MKLPIPTSNFQQDFSFYIIGKKECLIAISMYLVNVSVYILHNAQGLMGTCAFSDKQEREKKHQ